MLFSYNTTPRQLWNDQFLLQKKSEQRLTSIRKRDMQMLNVMQHTQAQRQGLRVTSDRNWSSMTVHTEGVHGGT